MLLHALKSPGHHVVNKIFLFISEGVNMKTL